VAGSAGYCSGAAVGARVQDALNSCPHVLVILSPDSVDSPNVENEIMIALEEHKTVIPVLYRDCKTPIHLRAIQYVDFRSDFDRGLKALIRVLTIELPQGHDLRNPKHIEPVASEVEAGRAKETTPLEWPNQIAKPVPEQDLPGYDTPSSARSQPVVLETVTPLTAQQLDLPESVSGETQSSHRYFYVLAGAIAAFVLLLAVSSVIVLHYRAKSRQNLADMEDAGEALCSSGQCSMAYTFIRKACDGGNAHGCYKLGWMYESGEGAETYKAQAVGFYRKACDGGDIDGCYNLKRLSSH